MKLSTKLFLYFIVILIFVISIFCLQLIKSNIENELTNIRCNMVEVGFRLELLDRILGKRLYEITESDMSVKENKVIIDELINITNYAKKKIDPSFKIKENLRLEEIQKICLLCILADYNVILIDEIELKIRIIDILNYVLVGLIIILIGISIMYIRKIKMTKHTY